MRFVSGFMVLSAHRRGLLARRHALVVRRSRLVLLVPFVPVVGRRSVVAATAAILRQRLVPLARASDNACAKESARGVVHVDVSRFHGGFPLASRRMKGTSSCSFSFVTMRRRQLQRSSLTP